MVVRIRTGLRFYPFMTSQIVFFIAVIVICTAIMGIASYGLLKSEIENSAIESNSKLLTQYSNTIDSLILNNVNETLNRIYQDVNDTPELNYYLRNLVEGQIVGILRVSEYLEKLKYLNPIINSIAIYYKNESLLVTTDKIRYLTETDNKYEEIKQRSIRYYDAMLKHADEDNSNSFFYILDKGKNMLDEYSAGNIPEDVLHVVRTIEGSGGIYGSIVITIDIEALNYIIKNYVPDSLESVIIVDENGIILLHNNKQLIGTEISGIKFASKAYKAVDKAGYYTTDSGGASVVISFQSSMNKMWKYIAVTPMFTLNTAVKFLLNIIITAAIISLVIGLVISLFSAKYLSRPIRVITDQCSKTSYSEKVSFANEYSIISGTLRNLTSMVETKEQEMKEIIPLLRANFISWITSNRPDKDEIAKKMKIMKIEFPFEYFCLIAIKIATLGYDEDAEDYNYEYEKARIELRFEKAFNTLNSICILTKRENEIFALINYNCDKRELWAACNEILDSERVNFDIYVSFGPMIEEISQIYTSWQIAEEGLRYSFLYPEKKLYMAEEIIKWESSGTPVSRMLLSNFTNSLKSSVQDKCIKDINLIVNTILIGNYNWVKVSAALTACISAIEEFLLEKDGKRIILNNDFCRFRDIFEFSKWLTDVINEEFEIRNSQSCNATGKLVAAAKEFIADNLLEPQLSLNTVADELKVSPNYLSRVFHNESNSTFIEYVTNLKMSLSRNMIVDTELKIGEISEKMGYSTPQYFISSFKKKFGYTPNVYREKSRLSKILDPKNVQEDGIV